MNNIFEFPRHDRRYDVASMWIAKLDNELSAADQDSFKEWMAADQENQTVFLEMAELWDKMGVLSRLSDLFPKPATHPARARRFRLATAAAIVVAVLAGVWTAIAVDSGTVPAARQVVIEKVPDTVYATAIGEQSTVHLQDGSQVVLNTDSLIEVNYTDKYRLLKLERGEMHVRVTHDNTRPFTVIAGDRIVKAMGTAFSLEITE
jgi:transmembrane sensor